MVATPQVWENMIRMLITRKARHWVDMQKALVIIYALINLVNMVSNSSP
jgi:hypothetical protein